ncbi:MAG: glycosyltransferase [Candidatus Obscuribacterales bacterium]|nr:glycosyltransferase [Candidatus Obscuribacterales bacterium]
MQNQGAKLNNFSVSVLICTRNRADVILRAIDSIEESTVRVKEIVVSDDSTNDQTKELLSGRAIKYVEGPRRGLSANRNNALRYCEGNFILFIDDDAVLGKSFLEEIRSVFERCSPKTLPKTIVTGVEENFGRIVAPNDQDFLGFQQKPYNSDEGLNTIVINSTVFPASLFSEISFDERLIYGCDEVDLTTRAVARGYNIKLCRKAINQHYPAPSNRDYYLPYANASRMYVTAKRYFATENSLIKGLVFVVLASLHHIGSNLKKQGPRGFMTALATLKLSWQYWCSFLLEQRRDHA